MGRNSRTFHRRQLPFLWHRELHGRWNARPRQTDTGSHTANRQMQRGPIPETGGKEQETQQELTQYIDSITSAILLKECS